MVHCFPFSAVYAGSILLPVLCSLIKVKVYTVIHRNSLIRVFIICHWQQSDQGLHYLPFSAVWSMPKLFAILSSLIRVYTMTFSAVWSGSTLFAILSSLFKVYTVCQSQQSDQCLHYLPFSASDQGLHCLPFSAVWSESTLFAILSLIRVYTVCHS